MGVIRDIQDLPVLSPSHLRIPALGGSQELEIHKVHTHQSDQLQQSRRNKLIHAMLAATRSLGSLLLTDMALHHNKTQDTREQAAILEGHPWAIQDLLAP